jgi:hypothetical protein
LLHHGRALFHILHGFTRFFLNSLNQVGYFFRGLRGFFRQLSHFLGHYGEAEAMFTCPGGFDRGIEGQ